MSAQLCRSIPPDLAEHWEIFHPGGQPYDVDEWPLVRSLTTGEEVVDEEYFKATIEPMLGEADVEFIGEIDERRKPGFLGEARGLLFPIDWPEPFGLVMIEAMACGTPVLAFRNGSVPEVIDEGVSGFVVDSE